MAAAQIPDGQTRTGTVAALAGRPPIKFVYRPALAEAVFDFVAIPKANGKTYVNEVSKLLMNYVVSWDVITPGGDSVPIRADTLKLISYQALDSMVSFVTGYSFEEQEADAKN